MRAHTHTQAGPLIAEGYDTMDRFARLTMEDLQAIGIKRGYARTILTSVATDSDKMRKDVEDEIPKLKASIDSVRDADHTCVEAEDFVKARVLAIRERIESLFRTLHEILIERQARLIEELDATCAEKLDALRKQRSSLESASETLKTNMSMVRQTVAHATPSEFSQVALPMLAKLRRLNALNWMNTPLEPVEDGSDVALHIRSTASSGVPAVVETLRSVGRVVDVCAKNCTVRFADDIGSNSEEKANDRALLSAAESKVRGDTSGGTASSVIVGAMKSLIVTARDRLGRMAPYGGVAVSLEIFEHIVGDDKGNNDETAAREAGHAPVNHVHKVFDNDNGTYRIEFSLPHRGTFLLFVTVNGSTVSGCPLRIEAECDMVFAPPRVRGEQCVGALYFLGTKKGSSAYVNPCDAGEVSVDCSSLFNGHASDAVDHEMKDTYTKNESDSWYCVDIGRKRRLNPTHYSLRNVQRSCAHAPRSWRLEASEDSKSWILLSERQDDDSIAAKPGASAVFAVEGTHPRGYRYFCVTQTGPNAFGQHFLVMGGIELFGTLREVERERDVDPVSSSPAVLDTPTTDVSTIASATFHRRSRRKEKDAKQKRTGKMTTARPPWNSRLIDVPKRRRVPKGW